MSAQLIVAPPAEAQIRSINRWWRSNRPAAPDLFSQELASAFATLSAMPLIGHPVDHSEVMDLRRVLLRATRYHVYYVASDVAVAVLAVWSSVRGAGPDLSSL